MTTRGQNLRSSTPGNKPAAGARQPGEIWINFADRQIGYIDAGKASQSVVAVRYFVTTSNYAIGDFVVQGGNLWVATTAVSAGAFNSAQWSRVAETADIPVVYVLPTASPTVLGGVRIDGTTIKIDGGGVISSAGLVAVATTPPVSPQNGSLWYDLMGGQLYAYVNDGTSSQWVVTVNQMVGGVYLPLSGGTLTGGLTIAPPSGYAPLILNAPASGQGMIVQGSMQAKARWVLALGDGAAETGANAGSNLSLFRYDDTGAGIDTPLAIDRKTGAVTAKGVTNGSDAQAGMIGEVIQANQTAPVTLTANSTPFNIGGVTLTAGDWDVQGEAWIACGSGTTTALDAAFGPTSGVMPAATSVGAARSRLLASSLTPGALQILPLRPARVSLTATTIYYLMVAVNYTGAAPTATSNIWARRAR